MVALKGKSSIGDDINKKILGPLAAALARAARRIARRRQVRVSRILAQPLGQLRHPLGQRRELLE